MTKPELNPQEASCPNEKCIARGQVGKGNIRVHSRKEGRYRCCECGKTFAHTRGTPFYRAHVDVEVMILILILLTHGCPVRAVVAAYGFDPRTVEHWLEEAGMQAKALHERLVHSPRPLEHVQLDELKVKLQGKWVWFAQAMEVKNRLWLGLKLSSSRNTALIRGLVGMVYQMAIKQPILLVTDGLRLYKPAILNTFRSPVHTGKVGRPKLEPWSGLVFGQVVKQYAGHWVKGVEQRLIHGSEDQLKSLLSSSKGGQGLNTAFIERLNATFRERLSILTRRSRRLVRSLSRLENEGWLLGTIYNFCSLHSTLGQTPAQAAGITDHLWTLKEVLWFKQHLPLWTPPIKRGPVSAHTKALLARWRPDLLSSPQSPRLTA